MPHAASCNLSTTHPKPRLSSTAFGGNAIAHDWPSVNRVPAVGGSPTISTDNEPLSKRLQRAAENPGQFRHHHARMASVSTMMRRVG